MIRELEKVDQPPTKRRKLLGGSPDEDDENNNKKPDDYYDRYSRQYYVIGERAMNSIGKSSVFISGIGGVGIEIAKNIALAGVKRLTLHDTAKAQWLDLSTQYFLQPESLGQNRAMASLSSVSQLNPYVQVDCSEHDLYGDILFLKEYDCVVLTQTPLSLQLRINDFCRHQNIKFITADTRGVFGHCFVDFGDEFKIFDPTGEPEKEIFVGNISRQKEAVVTCMENESHGLQDGDLVQFRDLRGMTELNFREIENEVYFKVKVLTSRTFAIDVDTTGFPACGEGGIAVEKKQTLIYKFKSLAESLESPDILYFDFSKMERPIQQHIAMQALHQFQTTHSELPRPWNQNDADELLRLSSEIHQRSRATRDTVLDESLIRHLSYTSRGDLTPLTTTVGGHASQEVLKAVSGKFTPLKQWLYLDTAELLVGTSVSDGVDRQPTDTRYDGLVVCVGRTTLQRLKDARVFMIGAGAIGCEMMKNYAMIGVGTGPLGRIDVADDDLIEKSNLNRQFLFRDGDLRTPKATTAAHAARGMNPDIHVEAYIDRVNSDSEKKFSDVFFRNHHVIVNALDNVPTRMYVDRRCVTTLRPLLESGTAGTKGHVQVILPHRTETYSDRRDPPEKDVPYCTIKSFPEKTEHVIEWAREKFESMFVSKPREVLRFLEDPPGYLRTARGASGPRLTGLRYVLRVIRNPFRNFSQCVHFARKKFEKYFRNDSFQLLHVYPPHTKLKDGTEFWKFPKKAPTPISFDPEDDLHVSFVTAAAHLCAAIYGVPREEGVWTRERVVTECALTLVPLFVPKDKNIVADEKVGAEEARTTTKPINMDTFQTILDELSSLPNTVGSSFSLNISHFEKDDDSNFHIHFIHACSSLRARNYSIPTVDRMETKRIAGKIIPAIATTTATVAGMVSLELIKVLQDPPPPLTSFKNTFLNLAIPVYALSEPAPPIKLPLTGSSFYTVWDSWELNEPEMTLRNFVNYFSEKYRLTVTGVFRGVKSIYLSMLPAQSKKLVQDMKTLLGVDEDYVDLTVIFADEEGKDVEAPTVRFHLKSKS